MASKLTDKELLEEISEKLCNAIIIHNSKEALLRIVKRSVAMANTTDDQRIRRIERRVKQANKRVNSLTYIMKEWDNYLTNS